MTEIDRCRKEQQDCRDRILSGAPDAFGAWLGLTDWLQEELRLEESGTPEGKQP